jgi:phosphatidylserine decarboxylase
MTKEGAIFPLPFFILAIIFYFLFRSHVSLAMLYLSAGLFYIGLAMMLFFRDPDRKIPSGENIIVSPADGKIVRIQTDGEEPELSIFLSIFNVHVNRSPVDGIIKSVTHHKGKFHIASRHAAMTDNERNEIEIETDKGTVKMHQVAGAIARRAICWKKPGDHVKAGERIGLIRFGSRVDLKLPGGSDIGVLSGRKVLAGETILGKLP